ncbi:flocculation protein FLO11-like [Cucumis melo var. makuwa]|uniref:Flocculation protein FLO11-like n=1 Tax=Cucumis melo var. makuwa TaxID=1194695 RepID=A0A5D3E1D9_CUCMM|nr:flocculation protein FLO11-like [Cucumis melo var. makuwa]TYK29401.1 flocculation protein FLO11-like [Cucumis melo var. makuwa]
MASSPPKNASPTKGKRYESIRVHCLFKKVHCLDATDDSNLHIPWLVLFEMHVQVLPLAMHRRLSSKLRDRSRPLSTPASAAQAFSPVTLSPPQSPKESSETDKDESDGDTYEDYVLGSKKTHIPKETIVSIDDPTLSRNNRTPEPQSTEVPRDSTTHLSHNGHVGSSFQRPLRPPVRRKRLTSGSLTRTISKVGLFYQQLIREQVVNQPSDFNNPYADEFHKVHNRGVCFNISLELSINFLESLYQMITLFPIPLPSVWLKNLLRKQCRSASG